MKTGQLSVVVIAIFLLTDTCTGSKSTRNKGNYETLLLFNPRSEDSLYAFLANSPGRDGGFTLVDSRSERSQYPSFFAQNKNYINPRYSSTAWRTNPPKQMMVEVNTYEDNTADIPFVTQRLHQQIFDAKDSTVYSWLESDRALDRRTATPFELSITALDNIFAYGIGDTSGGIMQWVISLYTRDSSQNIINVLLRSKSNTPPVIDDNYPLWDEITRTTVIKTFEVNGKLEVQLPEATCIRTIDVRTLYFKVTLDVYMYLGSEQPDVLWRTYPMNEGDPFVSSIKFKSVVCPGNMTLYSYGNDFSSLVHVTFTEVEGLYNIGTYVRVQGYYEEETGSTIGFDTNPTTTYPSINIPLDFPTDTTSETTSYVSMMDRLTESATSQTSMTELQTQHTSQTSITGMHTSQPNQASGQTTDSEITATSTRSSASSGGSGPLNQHPTTEGFRQVHTSESPTTQPCHKVEPRNWNRPINDSQRQALLEEIKELKNLLSVNKSSLTSTVRRKISAPDERVSSTIIGSVGGAILALVFGGLVLLDFPTIAVALKLMKRNLFGK